MNMNFSTKRAKKSLNHAEIESAANAWKAFMLPLHQWSDIEGTLLRNSEILLLYNPNLSSFQTRDSAHHCSFIARTPFHPQFFQPRLPSSYQQPNPQPTAHPRNRNTPHSTSDSSRCRRRHPVGRKQVTSPRPPPHPRFTPECTPPRPPQSLSAASFPLLVRCSFPPCLRLSVFSASVFSASSQAVKGVSSCACRSTCTSLPTMRRRRGRRTR